MSARALCFQIGTALLLSLGGLWAATQWAAAMLAYQPALGAPLAEAFGCALYAPWKLFGWWLAFDRQAPHVFNTAGLLAATGGVASGAVALGGRRLAIRDEGTVRNLRLGPLGGDLGFAQGRAARH